MTGWVTEVTGEGCFFLVYPGTSYLPFVNPPVLRRALVGPHPTVSGPTPTSSPHTMSSTTLVTLVTSQPPLRLG